MPWGFDLEEKVCRVNGRSIVIEEQLTEVYNEMLAQRHCLTLARDQDTNEEFLLKVRYDLNPKKFRHITDLDMHREIITHQYLCEADLVKTVHEIGHGPEFVHCATRTQREGFPHPKLKKQLILMKRVPGRFLDEIWRKLSETQLNSIKTQLAHILEHMRVNGKILTEQHPGFLQYDEATDKLYLVDFTFWTTCSPDYPPIDEESIEVLAFNIWRSHLRENPVLWGTEPHPAPGPEETEETEGMEEKTSGSKEQPTSASSKEKGKKREGRAPASSKEKGKKREERASVSDPRPPRRDTENIRPGEAAPSLTRSKSGKESGRRPPWRH